MESESAALLLAKPLMRLLRAAPIGVTSLNDVAVEVPANEVAVTKNMYRTPLVKLKMVHVRPVVTH
jgi:hypothetical protein